MVRGRQESPGNGSWELDLGSRTPVPGAGVGFRGHQAGNKRALGAASAKHRPGSTSQRAPWGSERAELLFVPPGWP